MTDELTGRIEGVCVGAVGELAAGRHLVPTAFVKESVNGPVRLTTLGFQGDNHVYEDHGGPDMAVLLYPIEHYEYWREVGLGLPAVGAFAENLTVTGLVETDVHIGDIFDLDAGRGSDVAEPVRLQICQTRNPCFKIASRYEREELPVMVQETGYTGYLARVLTPGSVSAGDGLRLVERTTPISVAEAGRIANVDRNDLDAARQLLRIEALGSSTRRMLEARIAAKSKLGLDTGRLFAPD